MATITVTGHARLSVPPDEARLLLHVEAVAALPADALAEIGVRARGLVDLLDELGVAPAKRMTTGVAVSEAGEHDSDGRWQHRGYRAVEQISVAAADPELIGTLIGEAVARAKARVQGPWWTVTPDNPVREEALQAAAEDARRRADVVAAGLGVRVGSVAEAKEERPEPHYEGPMFAPAVGTPPIEAGETTVSASVTVTFQAEPA